MSSHTNAPTHPTLELLNQLEWQTNDIPPPLLSHDDDDNDDNDIHTTTTNIVAYFPGNARLLLPPLYQTRNGSIYTRRDLSSTPSTTATTAAAAACNRVAEQRFERALVHVVEHKLLPRLVLQALFEEGLSLVLQSSQSGGTTTTSSLSSFSTTPPPLYYTTSPSSYLTPPPTTTTSSTTTTTTTSVLSQVLASRIQRGCALAYEYLKELQQYHSRTNDDHDNDDAVGVWRSRRSSRRLAAPRTALHRPTAPNPFVKGGRVCHYVLEEFHQIRDNEEEEKPKVQQEQQEEEDDNNNDDNKYKPDSPSNDDDNDEEEEEEDDDDEFDPQEGGSDEEESEEPTSRRVASKRRQHGRTVSRASSSSSSSSSSEDDDDDDDDRVTEEELILHNVHLQPDLESILEWMGRRPKHVILHHVQQAILLLLKEQRALPVGRHALDRLVLEHVSPPPPHVLPPPSKQEQEEQQYVVLECATGETVAQFLRQPHLFQRAKFTWKWKLDRAAKRLRRAALEEEQQKAAVEYKKQRAWAYYRYKGIVQTGWAVWPRWNNEAVVAAGRKWDERAASAENASKEGVDTTTTTTTNVATMTMDESATESATVTNTTTTDHVATTTTTSHDNADLELAKAMMLQEESSLATTSGRRKSRRGGGDSGAVFYGGQTGMSHKQLMDTIVRMAYTQPFQTMAALTALVAEESSNPMHRIRVALGKLLWKHNQVTRVRVNSVWTDRPCWNVLQAKSLLQVPEQIIQAVQEEEDLALSENDNDASEQAPAASAVALPHVRNHVPSKENLKHIKVLTEYIRGLHQTELNLRSLILNHLTSTPIAVVATAADERPDSQEAVDATHFEGDNHSSLDWSTSGHALLNQVIYRPSFLLGNEESPECSWYKIKDFVPSVPMPPMDEENMRSDARPRQVEWKEPLAVERRMRFRAYPVTEDGEELDQGAILVLTEGQVQAGIVAANLERKKDSHDKNLSAEHPFAIGAGTRITLQWQQEATTVTEKHCQVAGYDTVSLDNGELEHRILILPDAVAAESSERPADAFWAVVNLDENGILTCRSVGGSTTCKILQSDCDSSSSAYQECEGIIDFMYRQQHSAVFAEPVDPVALQIPTYFSVVKHPMDISTLSANLSKGVYSKIPPGQNVGRSPVARMLNGPFKDDVVRIFDNAMLFNPPDDWIHLLAASMKKTVVKKIDQVSREADNRLRAFSPRKTRSVYVDEDSDVDMYEYESDRDDEEFGGGRRASRKRKRIGRREDFSTQAIEGPVYLQKTLSESVGLRGPFSSLPINSEAAGFSLTSEWNCRHRTASSPEETKEDAEESKRRQEMEDLLVLHRQAEEMEREGLRRSSRAHPVAETANGIEQRTDAPNDFEYFLADPSTLPPIDDEEVDAVLHKSANSRSEVEAQREKLHEVYFAKLYQQLSKFLQPIDEDYGSYKNSSFPPFLGRVIPSTAPDNVEDVTWEIRGPFLIPAIRWVLRGLVHSGHLTEVDTDVLLTNDVYFTDDSQQPYDILDMKEMQRRRRGNIPREEESEEEVEMSEYEKLRAERVARNAERLKALGLA